MDSIKPRYLTLSTRAYELMLALPVEQQHAFNVAIWTMYRQLLTGEPVECPIPDNPILAIVIDMAREELVSGFNTYMQRASGGKTRGSGNASPYHCSTTAQAPADIENGKEQNGKESTGAEENEFEKFWAIYPLKVSRDKAKKAWMDLKPDATLLEEIMQGLKRWIESEEWSREAGRFIPHPQNFISNRRWQDEPRPAKYVAQVSAQQYDQRGYDGEQAAAMRRMFDELHSEGERA